MGTVEVEVEAQCGMAFTRLVAQTSKAKKRNPFCLMYWRQITTSIAPASVFFFCNFIHSDTTAAKQHKCGLTITPSNAEERGRGRGLRC